MENEVNYVYNAKVVSVYDGDTITVDIDLGFKVMVKKESIRLWGINTPEVRGDSKVEWKKVRDYVRERILWKDIILKSYKGKKWKYGRWLWEVIIDWVNLNDELVEMWYAVEYLR